MTLAPADSVNVSRHVLIDACRTLGLDSGGAEPIRIAENAIWRLPGKVVARISRPGGTPAASREIAVANWLADNGIPAVRPAPGITEPITIDGRAVTIWEELPPHRDGNVNEVAHLLKALHALPEPDFDLEPLEPFRKIRTRLDQAKAIKETDLEWLYRYTDSLEEAWLGLLETPGLSRCVLHGDAWVGNVASADDGTAYLLDLDGFTVGPREWDLTSTAVKLTSTSGISRYDYEDFCTIYGADVTTSDGYEVLRDIRELRMTAYAARITTEHPDHPHARDETQYRIECLMGGQGQRPWRWTAVP
ncbi:aminoglycoside phosphotransferase family protein [Streptomyces antarcticus]|uniref:aminoglycoside phosphotransferase family protein n=1 Tax=Streptomyces antarcticus TaxID=2996458 RepID=UPI0022AF5BE1|nr:aminoglycoside phosphotransferase family protein [Streptomyces sp. H34-S5]MCZ4083284.1 aminoglycoside phosphotransferase family protein [Streptomyces sp. H34-S5]